MGHSTRQPGGFGFTPGRLGGVSAQSNGNGVSSDAFPTVFNGAIFGDVNVPSKVAAGDTIVVNGVAGFDCPHCVVDREIRVVLQATHLGDDRIEPVGDLNGRGQTAPFEFRIPAPQEPGTGVSIRLQAQRREQWTGSWITDNTAGPFSVNVVSPGEQITSDLLAWAPWAVGGGAVGVGAAHVTDRTRLGGGVLGAGLGVSAKVLTDTFEVDQPEFPLVPVAATGGLLLAGAFLLGNLNELLPG